MGRQAGTDLHRWRNPCRLGAGGLQALPDSVRADEFVLVHDAARPNLSLADLGRLLEVGRADPVGAILAAPVRDTLKRAGDDGGIDGTEPRERLWRALTPQLFRRHQLSRALSEAAAAGVEVTDEAMAMERQGQRPPLVEGSEDNFASPLRPISTGSNSYFPAAPADRPRGPAARVASMSTAPFPPVRIGQGYDVHAFGEGDHIMLGG